MHTAKLLTSSWNKSKIEKQKLKHGLRPPPFWQTACWWQCYFSGNVCPFVLMKLSEVCPAGVRWDCKLFGQVGFVVGLVRLPKVLAIAPAEVYAGSRTKSSVVFCPCFTVTSFSVLSLNFGADMFIV